MSNLTIKQYFSQEGVQNKFAELLGSKSKGFVTSVMQVATSNALLAKADPASIYNAAAMAATLDLPINNNLGFAWIVPYNEKYKDERGNWQQRCVAQFQMGWKGYVQLAQRTGQYLRINVVEIWESQFVSYNAMTEELNADFNKKADGKVIGYAAYFKLINGFEKTSFWYKEKVTEHGQSYSKSFNNGPWKDKFDAMAKKTVLKDALSKWGPLSIDLQTAYVADSGVIEDVEHTVVNYPDAGESIPAMTEDDVNSAISEIAAGNTTPDEVATLFSVTPEQMEVLNNTKPQ